MTWFFIAVVIALALAIYVATRPGWHTGGVIPPSAQEAEAAAREVNYRLVNFWPPAHKIYNENLPLGVTVWVDADGYICPEMYAAAFGDLVPVYHDSKATYWYEIVGFSRAAGDDHVYSPKQFTLEFREWRTK